MHAVGTTMGVWLQTNFSEQATLDVGSLLLPAVYRSMTPSYMKIIYIWAIKAPSKMKITLWRFAHS
jgi:hypothetical protein